VLLSAGGREVLDDELHATVGAEVAVQPETDPYARGQLRWWDGLWTSHTVRGSRAPATTALILGIAAFVLICFPIVGVAVSVIATALAVRAVRRDLDDYFAVSVLTFNVVTLSLSMAGLAYSLWLGFYGIVLSPWPA
jgi:hypothetical protein